MSSIEGRTSGKYRLRTVSGASYTVDLDTMHVQRHPGPVAHPADVYWGPGRKVDTVYGLRGGPLTAVINEIRRLQTTNITSIEQVND